MSVDLIKYAFVAGELSPTFFGRTDLTKYDLAMAEAYNFFVDYRGGLSNRAGFEFVDYIPDYAQGLRTLELIEPPLFFNFVFDQDVEYNFLGIICPINATGTTNFSHSIIRFLQNGAYVKEPMKMVTAITLANPAVLTSLAHGFTTGDWVIFSNDRPMNYEWRKRTVVVEVINANTFSARSLTDGELIDSTLFNAYIGGYGVSRILTIQCTYLPEEYKFLSLKQHRDLIRVTHASHPIRNLIRSNNPADGVIDEDGNVWRLEAEVIGSTAIGPVILSHTSSAAPEDGSLAQVIFAVSSVYADGSESIRGPMYKITDIVNYPATEGSVSIVWTQDPNAEFYNVYRSLVSVTEVLSSGTEVGFVGQAKGTKFTDPNIIPDFTRLPPTRIDPFAVQPIVEVNVTAGGAGYVDFATTAQALVVGTGFAGEAIVNDIGAVVNVAVRSRGKNYTVGDNQPAIVTFVGAGAGATATVRVDQTLGTYPAVSCVFQQRQLYGGSYDGPTTIWGSQVKQFSNFDVTPNLVDSDSFEFVLDTPSFASIRHFIPTQGGLLVTTQESIWVLNGGGPADPITPTNAVAIPQTHNGVALVHPIKVGSDLLYAEGKGHAVRVLAYNEIQRVYSGDDRSILSNHLFGLGRSINSWAYQEEPFKLVWSARSDGELLAFTIVKSEDIYAWTPCGTRGQFLSVANIRENNAFTTDIQIINDRVYVVTQRYLQGRWRRMIERMALRNFVNVEDAFFVDCGWDMPANACTGNLNLWLEDGVWYAQTDTGDLLNIAELISEFSEVVELNL